MNVKSINGMTEAAAKSSITKSSNNLSSFTKGEVIEGKILKVADKISIDFNGKEMTVPKSAIPDAKEGELRHFEVMNVSNENITLKEIESSEDTKDNEENTGIVCTTVETDRSALQEHLEKTKEENYDFEEAQKILDDILSRMTEADYKALTEEGISPESYMLDQLDKALNRIKEQITINQKNVEGQIEKNIDYKEQLQKIGVANLCDSPYTRKIAEKLLNANLPVTKENIEKIAEALNLSKTAQNLSDKAIGYILDKELEPTIENLYQATYSGYQGNGKITESVWKEISSQAEVIIENAGMEINDKTRNCARWLIENNLPLTTESLENYYSLEDIRSNYSEETVLDKIIETVATGVEPTKTFLENIDSKINKILDKLETVTDTAIEKTVEENKKINLVNLIKAQEEIDQINKVGEKIPAQQIELGIETITAKRQLEEIRLKMTVEAGNKLLAKGIRLDTTELAKVVESLKEMEDSYYKNLLKEGRVSDSNENLEILKETSEKVEQLKEAPSYVLGTTFHTRTAQTVTTLHENASNIKSQLEKANVSYEALSTEIRSDLGDSIEKAFQNVNSILDSMEMDQTKENQRAVKILGYNSMEITEQSINDIKAYDSQVNNLMKELHPAVTVELIKRNINPLNTPIEQLNQQIKEIKGSLGITEEEKYSKYLWKLDKNQELTQEERKAYVGIYRLLNNIEKTNGAAVGSVLNAGEEVTLNNLLRAVRTKKSGGIDKTIDDTFGTLESLTFKKETITDQIYSAFHSNANDIIDHIIDVISPEKLKEISEGMGETTEEKLTKILDIPLENLGEKFSEFETKEEQLETEYNKQKVEEIKNIAQNSQKELSFLTQVGIEPSISSLQAAQYLLSEESPVFKEINGYLKNTSLTKEKEETKNILEELEDSISNDTQLQENYKKLEENVKEILSKEYESPIITAEDISQLKLLGNTVQLMQSLSKQEHYEIPIQVGESITNVRLTVIRGAKEAGKVHINVNSETLGNIEGELSINKEKVKGFFLCDSRIGLETLQEEKTELGSRLKEIGLDLDQMNYSLNRKVKDFYTSNQTDEKTNTKILYQAAKILIKTIKIAEQKQI